MERVVDFLTNSVTFYLYSSKSQKHLPQGALYCKVNTVPYQQPLGNSGREKLTFKKEETAGRISLSPWLGGSVRGQNKDMP